MSRPGPLQQILLFLSCLWCAGVVWGQTAEVTGQVTDPFGAKVPGATVTLTNTDTGVHRKVTSNAEGLYTVPFVRPGPYRIAVEKAGFQLMAREDVRLQVDQVLRLDFALQVGAITQAVEVAGTAPLVESETASVGQVVQGRQVTELPLLGRNPYALGGLAAGVRIAQGMNGLPVDIISTSYISINGSRANQNEYLLDGAPNTAAAQNQPVVYPSVDDVQEFKVQTNAYSAEYGRAAGGVFNVVTKYGTNELHFTAYEFLRNNDLNANDWFANGAGQPIAPFRFNQFGGTVSGPMVLPSVYDGRNRTFFFLSTELVRFIQGDTFTATVPTAAELSGDFSQTRNAAGQPLTIYDSATTRSNGSGGFVRDPVPGNVIPSNRIDPISRKIATYWPAPSASGAPFTHTNNFVRTDSSNIQKNTWSARVDENLNDANRFFVRVSRDDSPWVRALPYGSSNIASPTGGPQDFGRSNVVVEEDHIFSPGLIVLLRTSYSRLSNLRNAASYGFDLTKLGFPAAVAQQLGAALPFFPVITITGYTVNSSISNTVVPAAATLGSTGTIAQFMNQAAVEGQITKVFSRHNLKAGAEIRVLRYNLLQNGDGADQFTFGNGFTQGPNPSAPSPLSGYAFATFLFGVPGGSYNPAASLAMQTLYYAGYMQDDWKFTDRLTLNLGLRYELELPRTDRFNQLTNFNYSAAPPLNAPGLNLHGTLSFVGVNGVSRYDANPVYDNLAPRLGLAYRLNSKTAIRAGGGLFYGSSTGFGGSSSGYGVSGFEASTSIVSSLDGVTPIVTFANPYPTGLNQSTGSKLGAATLLGQSVTFYDRGNVLPRSGQWNFDIQRELPGSILLDIGYVGTRGLKLPISLTLNQLPNADLSLKDALRQQVPNPFYGQIMVGTLALKTISQAQLLLPYPHFLGVTSQNASASDSTYHALQMKVEKRYAKGLTLLASYTFSKMMDLSTGDFSGETLGGGAIQNWNNLPADWSVSSLDQTHRLSINVVYQLPFFSVQHGFVSRLLGGWEVGVIGSVFSGGPLGITSAVNNTFSQGGGQRPNWSGKSAKLSDPTPQLWFDASQFSAPPAYTFGNAPRTYSGLRDDGTRGIDMSLIKDTRMRERLHLQVRAEAFNLTNTPRFAPPGQSFGAPGFGVVSSQSNQPRVVQFALKLLY
jgi:outer membrane receptor protein involved in Fe transport